MDAFQRFGRSLTDPWNRIIEEGLKKGSRPFCKHAKARQPPDCLSSYTGIGVLQASYSFMEEDFI